MVANIRNLVFQLGRKLGEISCWSAKPEVIISNPTGSLCSSGDKYSERFGELLIGLLSVLCADVKEELFDPSAKNYFLSLKDVMRKRLLSTLCGGKCFAALFHTVG